MSVAEEDKSHVVVVVAVNDIVDNGCPRSSAGGDEIVGVSEKERGSCVSECCVGVVDLDDVKVHLVKVERDCRICHLSMDMSTNNNHDDHDESGTPIELGCSCKDDLAAAHKHCAEAWFKIKGNK